MKKFKLFKAILSVCFLMCMFSVSFAEEDNNSQEFTDYKIWDITFAVPTKWLPTVVDDSTIEFKNDVDEDETWITIYALSGLSEPGNDFKPDFYKNIIKDSVLNEEDVNVLDDFGQYTINEFLAERIYVANDNEITMWVFLSDEDSFSYVKACLSNDFTWDTYREIEKVIVSFKNNNQINRTEEKSTNSETTKKSNSSKEKTGEMSVAELEARLLEQPMYVSRTEYLVQDENYKALYPDLLSAVIVNNSNTNIKNAKVAFVAWDSNNFPVKIVGNYDYSGGNYVSLCDFGDVNMIPGSTFGENMGMEISDRDQKPISTFKAIVYEYIDFDGNVWSNPYFKDWKKTYENKILVVNKIYTDSSIVMKVQMALNDAGFDCGEPDGSAGPKTRAAIIAFSDANNLSLSGEVDDMLLTALGLQ